MYLYQTTLVGMLKILYNVEAFVDQLEKQNPKTLEILTLIQLVVKVCLDTINNY
jgi:hypothetical protein